MFERYDLHRSQTSAVDLGSSRSGRSQRLQGYGESKDRGAHTSFGNIAFSFRLSAMICAALKLLRWILVPLALNATIAVNIS
ncbi:MAG: hypothetical protein CR217_04105 [Beijerinckiaceae bacterium]|nr:MAG: hypothetical protein CR217_04105 [Beijerinckiaceae bacterium]